MIATTIDKYAEAASELVLVYSGQADCYFTGPMLELHAAIHTPGRLAGVPMDLEGILSVELLERFAGALVTTVRDLELRAGLRGWFHGLVEWHRQGLYSDVEASRRGVAWLSGIVSQLCEEQNDV